MRTATKRTREQTARMLYGAAERADARYSEVIHSRTNGQRDRWTLTAEDERIPEIRESYREKVNADEAWLAFLRWANANPL